MRYPLVCAQCLPTVEDEIRQKDHTSRVHALAGFLKETKGKDRKRRVSGPRRKQKFRLAVWWLKGALWCITLIGVVACHSAGQIRRLRFEQVLLTRWICSCIRVRLATSPWSYSALHSHSCLPLFVLYYMGSDLLIQGCTNPRADSREGPLYREPCRPSRKRSLIACTSGSSAVCLALPTADINTCRPP